MGNASSSGRGHHDETVDFGYLTPQGIYTGPRDWNQAIVTQLIVDRKLAPFYRPLEDYEESWDEEQIIAAMKEPPQVEGADAAELSSTRADSGSMHSSSSRTHHKRPSASAKEQQTRQVEASVYRGAAECPICFLYYPSNINHSRCCDQAICTECFVQIKRADPTTTHLVSEPASCPYCVQENFGVVYTPPSWRAGINSEGWPPPPWTLPGGQQQHARESPNASMKRRRKSFGPDSPEVVSIDQIRPDWEAKLAAVRAAVARRANRRIIMRQVGDRLIPVGISSGRVHALNPDDVAGAEGEAGGNERGSRRSRRRHQNPDLNQYLGQMGLAGQDLEELMVMEAMRLSLLEEEERQRKQNEEEEKKRKAQSGANEPTTEGSGAGSSVAVAPTPVTTPPAQTSPALLSPTSAGPIGRARSASSASRRSGDGLSQRSHSPGSAVVAAIRSAVNTANAVGSPPREHEISSSLSSQVSSPEFTSPDLAGPELPASHTNDSAATVRVTPPENSAGELPGSTVEEDGVRPETTPTTSTHPLPMERNMSFTSSIEPRTDGESYDYLPSSPGSSTSSLAQKPLLDSPSAPPQTPGTLDGNASTSFS
ncbi:RING-HC finger protein [Phanerochaete sordida]|uniref:RING-HC finger protein n=1 Tax=Phanerochaete sordida TaxID=48140 RepID=A0A9P3G2C3_9APHY|nr:RING-HC finger protein [Phanerochaete sordida]